jgi:bifunctional non-homologous end joining protein LigD
MEQPLADPVWFPGSDVRHSDVRYHYRRVAPVLLPHLRDRHLVVDWFEAGPKGAEACPDPTTLLRFVATGALGFQAATWRSDRPDAPDRVVFDLDPPGDDFEPVKEAAGKLREGLQELGLDGWLLLTGSRGCHVVVPLDKKATFDEARRFGAGVAAWLAQAAPDVFVAGASADGRVGIDPARTGPDGCAVAPYTIRRFEGGPVATPIDWDEIGKRGMNARKFDVWNVLDRLERVGDPWALIARHGRSLKLPLKKLAKKCELVEILAA